MGLKQDIEQYFTSLGFHQEDDNIIFERIQVHQIVINGQPIQQNQTSRFELLYLGEGFVGDTPSIGYSVVQEGENILDGWLTELKDIELLGIQYETHQRKQRPTREATDIEY